jgi:hypothetical protein
MKENLTRGLAETMGTDAAAKIAETLIGTVIDEKRRLEASGRGSA